MALFGCAPATIKPTALVLNILVSVIVSVRFYRAGYFSWQTFWPLAAASLPAALLGGFITLPTRAFNSLLGGLLLVAAVPLLFRRELVSQSVSPPRLPIALLAGGSIGFLSGLTGVGGGVLITPLLLQCRWAPPKQAAAISAAFIFVNSVAALTGHLSFTPGLPQDLAPFALAAVLGGWVGAQLGSAHLSDSAIFRMLGTVLLIAGFKLLLL